MAGCGIRRAGRIIYLTDVEWAVGGENDGMISATRGNDR